MKVSVASLEESSAFHTFMIAVNSTNYSSYEWNSTIIDNVLVQLGENMYLNASVNNDFTPREGFLSLNYLPTVVCCRHVLRRLFMSTGL